MNNPSDEDDSWLARSLKSARLAVAKWPNWKKKAMRVIPEGHTIMSNSFVCDTCYDTHKMWFGDEGEERIVACTFCPTPCQNCRGHLSAYCKEVRCACDCHSFSQKLITKENK